MLPVVMLLMRCMGSWVNLVQVKACVHTGSQILRLLCTEPAL